MSSNAAPHFRKNLIAWAAAATLAPTVAWSLDLAHSPPGTIEPYVAPNVIISIDDSGSMNYRLDKESTSGASNRTTPDLPGGGWSMDSRRMNVLKYALIGKNGVGGVFRDTTLIGPKKIRLGWQAMNGNNSRPSTLNTGTTVQSNTNSMKVLDTTHRTNFINFVDGLSSNSSTPSHKMFKQADEYMRLPPDKNGPWAAEPGVKGAPYLGCRRNYHIFMTDGRWNGTASGGSQDDNTVNKTIPIGATVGGTIYGSSSSSTRPKTHLYADKHSDTLADWAFKSWADPLQTTGVTGTPQLTADYRKAPLTESFGKDSTGKDASLPRFWNPKYNPAEWPHMVTYTIGFSRMAFEWDYAQIVRPTETVPFGWDGSIPDLINGVVGWPSLTKNTESRNALDLWHAALNGRGRFYAVEKGEDLEKAFREIFQQINTQVDPQKTSTATSGSNTSRVDVARFTGSYEPDNAWKGFVTAETVKKGGAIVSTPGWGGKNTADKLDALPSIDSRLILTWGDNKWDSAASRYLGGVPFKWANNESNLSNAQKLALQSDVNGVNQGATAGQRRLNYIRGDHSYEGTEPNNYPSSKPYRERKSRQGDIINSMVWYTGAPSDNYPLNGYAQFLRDNKERTPMIYVGGNDGMLHGFSAEDGSEKIAYVPRGVISSLNWLTEPSYNNKHRAFVDGSPMTGDVNLAQSGSPDWRTMLVGTLGAGGKGYFVLDVSNPTGTGTTAAPIFQENKAKELVRLDRTRAAGEPEPVCSTLTGAEKSACETIVLEDRDIGHITAQPVVDDVNPMRATQITRMNNNRWAAVLGNGYNSSNQRPVLLIQYLDGDQALVRIPATQESPGSGIANDNGLAAPRVVDLDGDGRVDIVYAGDNQGNLWKFDLTSDDSSQWAVAFGGQPLFTARGTASLGSSLRNNIQPITAPPTVRANDRKMLVGSGASEKSVPVGGMMVAFGTGRNVAVGDPESSQVQTLYSVLDNTRYRVRAADKTKPRDQQRLEVHPGGGTCSPLPAADCVPAPQALGTGVATAKLAQQKITEVNDGDFGVVDIEESLDEETWAEHNGWYMDFPAVGERLLKPMEFYDGSNILTVYSQVPAKGSDVDPDVETCEASSVDEERQYRTLINIMDGRRPTVQLVDYNGDGLYNADDAKISRVKVHKGPHTLIAEGNKIMDIDVKDNKEELARMPEESSRPSWRQMK